MVTRNLRQNAERALRESAATANQQAVQAQANDEKRLNDRAAELEAKVRAEARQRARWEAERAAELAQRAAEAARERTIQPGRQAGSLS